MTSLPIPQALSACCHVAVEICNCLRCRKPEWQGTYRCSRCGSEHCAILSSAPSGAVQTTPLLSREQREEIRTLFPDIEAAHNTGDTPFLIQVATWFMREGPALLTALDHAEAENTEYKTEIENVCIELHDAQMEIAKLRKALEECAKNPGSARRIASLTLSPPYL
jgi:hypothetical protein